MDTVLKALAVLLLFAVQVHAQGLTLTHAGGIAIPQGTWSGSLLQDHSLSLGSVIQCSSTSATSCTWSGFLPTTANSAFLLEVTTGNNVTVSSITWSCGGTWAYNVKHLTDATNSINMLLSTNFTNTGGCTSLTINVSGAPGTNGNTGAGIFPSIIEFACISTPCSVDQTSTQINASCSTACTLPPFNSGNSNALTATDVVMVFPEVQFTMTNVNITGNGVSTYNAYSSPYEQDYGGDGTAGGIAFNAPAGALTGTGEMCNGSGCPATGWADFLSVAVKSSLGSFAVTPSAIWSPVNAQLLLGIVHSLSTSGTNITIGSTAGGDLITVVLTGPPGDFISACSIGGTNCVVNASCRATQAGIGAISMAYILSDPSGQTTISITTTTTANYGVGVYEHNKSSGTPVFDNCNSTSTGTATNTPTGPTLTLSGTDDLVFDGIVIAAGSGNTTTCIQANSLVPFPYDAWSNSTGQVYNASCNTSSAISGSVGFAMNVASAPAVNWSIYNSNTSAYAALAVAFK